MLVKMDIEGAEFVVLPSLLASGAACLIDELLAATSPGAGMGEMRLAA